MPRGTINGESGEWEVEGGNETSTAAIVYYGAWRRKVDMCLRLMVC